MKAKPEGYRKRGRQRKPKLKQKWEAKIGMHVCFAIQVREIRITRTLAVAYFLRAFLDAASITAAPSIRSRWISSTSSSSISQAVPGFALHLGQVNVTGLTAMYLGIFF